VGETKQFWKRYVVLTLGERERIPVRISPRMVEKLGLEQKMKSDVVLR
jgi:hypothetical protein